MQVTDTVLMVAPDDFEYNHETATTNTFQNTSHHQAIKTEAAHSFNQFKNMLEFAGIDVLLLKNNSSIKTPDAVFPNNWFSVQRIRNQLTLILYPMFSPNRRAERCQNQLLELLSLHQIHIDKIIDLTYFEKENKALEGTGSIVFDHEQRISYVSLSKRSHPDVLKKLTQEIEYKPIAFTSYDKNGNDIYHTNVMMSIGKHFVVICKESIRDTEEQKRVLDSLTKPGKQIIEISIDQLHGMAGNILELKSKDNTPLLLMSTQASQNFSPKQREILEQYTHILHTDLRIIETVGGGSARCMLAEIFK